MSGPGNYSKVSRETQPKSAPPYSSGSADLGSINFKTKHGNVVIPVVGVIAIITTVIAASPKSEVERLDQKVELFMLRYEQDQRNQQRENEQRNDRDNKQETMQSLMQSHVQTLSSRVERLESCCARAR